jgi:hypothetical protein
MIANNPSVPSNPPNGVCKRRSPLDVAVVEHIASTDTADGGTIEVSPESRGVIDGQSGVIIGESHYFATG